MLEFWPNQSELSIRCVAWVFLKPEAVCDQCRLVDSLRKELARKVAGSFIRSADASMYKELPTCNLKANSERSGFLFGVFAKKLLFHRLPGSSKKDFKLVC